MASKKYLIYSGIAPSTPIEVSASERKEYLKCKFWKASQQEAWVFFYCYFPPSSSPSLCRLLLVLSGRLFKTKGFAEACEEAWKLNDKKLLHCLDVELATIPEYKKIIKAFEDKNISDSYPHNGLLDEIILWATDNALITNKKAYLIKNKLESIRNGIVNYKRISEEVRLSTLKVLINYDWINPILYSDAQALLFPNHDFLSDLQDKAYFSSNNEHVYFTIKSLLKWLMQNDYLPESLLHEFKELKIEAIKENLIAYEGAFNSLQKLEQQGFDRNDLLYEASQGKPLYLNYPRDCLKWRSGVLVKPRETSTQRYDGFGQLKRNKTDDTYQCQFGGFTLDMLRQNEHPKGLLQEQYCKDYEIELVPTEKESCEGLQPYVSVPHTELVFAIAKDRLGFLEDTKLSQTNNDQNNTKWTKNNLKKHGRKSFSRLQLLIQKILTESKDKSPEAIWKIIRQDKNLYFWIDQIEPWSNGRKAVIQWGTRHVTNKTLSRAAFETYVSKLNTGKEPFSTEQYDDVYKNEDDSPNLK